MFPTARRAVLMRDVLSELSLAPDGTLPFQDIVDRLVSRHAQTDEERIVGQNGWGVFPQAIYRTSGRARRAGWMTRRGGRWTITDLGRAALLSYADSQLLWDKAKSADADGDGIPDDEEDILPYVGEIVDWSRREATIFKQGHASIEYFVASLDNGALGLPDLQRPFVWDNVKVRNLLDSMFRGFPIGYLLLWDNPILKTGADARNIGPGPKGTIPKSLIIDGQQRLTSLYAVMTGKPVMDEAFRERRIEIAFHPVEGRFEVCNPAIRKDAQWVPDVSELFRNPTGLFQFLPEYMRRLKSARAIGPEHEQAAIVNLQRLIGLKTYTVGTLEISADADEEQVAEVFVRVNSAGQNLKQSDFILTLLSVFWEKGREELERFARDCRQPAPLSHAATPANRLLHPDPDDLLRVSIIVSHRRARLSQAYQVLRGRDPESGRVTTESRDRSLNLLSEAQQRVLDPSSWHDFLLCLGTAGFRTKGLIQSQATSFYSYAFFLLGRREYEVPKDRLRRLTARLFLMANITGRYTSGSPETAMEADLARLRSIKPGDAEGFVCLFEDLMAAELTPDFWGVTLPGRFESSSLRTLSVFIAALCVLDAKALFSRTGMLVERLLDPEGRGALKDLEIHHLFPRAWLLDQGITEPRLINQIANLTPIEAEVNKEISDKSPRIYEPAQAERSSHTRGTTAELHALPVGWAGMSYAEFLRSRRVLMAGVVRRAFEHLRGGSSC